MSRDGRPWWLVPDVADEGYTILGRGMDDVDDVPEVNRPAAEVHPCPRCLGAGCRSCV